VKVTSMGQSCTVTGYQFNETLGPAFLPDFPASSPYVTTVGAVALQWYVDPLGDNLQASLDNPEVYCNSKDPASFSGGGGFSMYQPMPDYQRSVVETYLASGVTLPPPVTFNGSNRGYPDVSFLGHNFVVATGPQSPSQGYSYPIQIVGGTSASSPSFAGMVAHLNDFLLENGASPLGFLNPFLYQMAQIDSSTFNDIVPHTVVGLSNNSIVVGNFSGCTQTYCCQYGFQVSTGWDPATGLGTPNYPAILSYLKSYNNLTDVSQAGKTIPCNILSMSIFLMLTWLLLLL